MVEDRVARERAFHNERFREETRDAQAKYYLAIRDGEAAFSRRVEELAHGADVLEYGCGNASQARFLAPSAKSVQGIDISDVAIANAHAAAQREGLSNVGFQAMNAEAMSFADASFDLVFGRGIIHHLDLEKAFAEIARVLRPGGRALFWEPLGHNVLINFYRAMTPSARTPDEHPLLKRDFAIVSRHFETTSNKFYGLASLASVAFGAGRAGEAMLRATAGVDRVLFAIPGLKWQAWFCAMELARPKRAA